MTLPGNVLAIIRGLVRRVGYAVAALVPRRRNLWVFGSWYGTRFAENPRYLFLHCLEHFPNELQVVWITGDRNLVRVLRERGWPVAHRWSAKGLWYALRAGVYVFDCRTSDINHAFSSGAVKVNLWHGIPLKRIERDIENSLHPFQAARQGPWHVRLYHALTAPTNLEEYDLVLCPSPFVLPRFTSAFGVSRDRMLLAGYPRTEPLQAAPRAALGLLANESAFVSRLQQCRENGERVLFYLPTFRDHHNVAEAAIPLAWSDLEKVLEREGGRLFCKLHDQDRRVAARVGQGRIDFIPRGTDLYPLLPWSDALITDYSSVFFDYLLADRPLLFYPYDLAQYTAQSRTFYDDYESTVPGPVARTASDVTALIEDLLRDYDRCKERWSARRAELRLRFWGERGESPARSVYDALHTQLLRRAS